MHQIVTLPREAPDKPLLGSPCNGCGLCCAAGSGCDSDVEAQTGR